MNLTPTAKVSAVGAAGAAVTVILQLLQQYAPGFQPPSAATVALLLSVVVSAAGWITRDISSPNPAPPVAPASGPPAGPAPQPQP